MPVRIQQVPARDVRPGDHLVRDGRDYAVVDDVETYLRCRPGEEVRATIVHILTDHGQTISATPNDMVPIVTRDRLVEIHVTPALHNVYRLDATFQHPDGRPMRARFEGHSDLGNWIDRHRRALAHKGYALHIRDEIDPIPESIMPRYSAPAAPRPRAPGTRYLARDARNAGTARPIPPAPIRTPDDRRSPMFDVTDRRAVDRLAAVVVMLEQREAEARQAFDEISDQIRDMESARVPLVDQAKLAHMRTHMWSELSRWTEAQSALAAARELATDR